MKLFRRKYTKWLPLGNYRHAESDYIVFARKNLETGMLQFKTREVANLVLWVSLFVPANLIDIRKQWEMITKE